MNPTKLIALHAQILAEERLANQREQDRERKEARPAKEAPQQTEETSLLIDKLPMTNQYCAYVPSAPKPSPPPAAQTDPTHFVSSISFNKSYYTLLNSSTKSLQQIRIIKKTY